MPFYFHFCFLNPSLTCTPGKDEFQANFTVKLALQVYYSPSLATHLLWRWKSVIRAKLSMVCQVTIRKGSHGTRTCIKRKKCSMVNVLIFVHKNVYRIRFQKIKMCKTRWLGRAINYFRPLTKLHMGLKHASREKNVPW